MKSIVKIEAHFCISNSNITSWGLISSSEKVLKHFNTDSFGIICKMSAWRTNELHNIRNGF